MITKASILWTLAFVICSFAQTTTDGTDPSQITPTFSAPSLSEFAASAGSNPADTSNSGDVAATTPDDITQPDSDTPNNDLTAQNPDTSSETATQGSDEPDDLTASAGADTALTDTGDEVTTTPDETAQPDSNNDLTVQDPDASSETDSAAQNDGAPGDLTALTTPTSVGSETAGQNPDDVTTTTTNETTQPDSDGSNTDSTAQSTDTPSETDNTTQGSDEPDDLTTSAGSDTALTDSGDVAPTTPDGTTEPGSDEQSADTSSGTDNTTQSSGEPDDSLPTNVITHTADEASIGADDALELNTDANSGAQDGTDQGSGEPDGAEQNSTGSDAANSTENNATLEDSTLTATNETEGLVHDAHNYPEGVNASTPFPQSVITEMSKREMRYHHYLWHQVREGWNKFTPEVQQRYTELGWAPPRPARNYDEEGSVSPIMDNDSGEDFLYMHREMINTVNEIITRNNESYGNVTGWKTIPAPGDPDWPVPDNYTIPGDPLAENSSLTRKSDEYFARIQNAEITFKDPDQLRSMTLGELGARMEVTIHAWLHMRFSENCSVGIRTEYLNKTNLPYIEKIWDDPLYNWLGDTYSSQVFPTFYKIHGWVDDRIGDWMAANNITELQWNGTWTGGPWENVSPMLMTKQSMNLRGSAAQNAESSGMKHSGGMNVLEEVMDIFLKSGVREVSIADEVKLDWAPWEKLEEPKKV